MTTTNKAPIKIKQLMKDKGLSQKELSAKTKLPESTISRCLNGDGNIKVDTLTKIAKALDTTSNDLLGFDGINMAIATFGTVLATMVSGPVGMIAGLNYANKTTNTILNQKKKEKENDLLSSLKKEIEKFKKISKGIILSELSDKNIDFSSGNEFSIDEKENDPDFCLWIKNSFIKTWWFVFWTEPKEIEKNISSSLNEKARFIVSKFMITSPSKTRKSTIIVDNVELFNSISELKDRISYKGNLSVALIDTDKYCIVNEINLSYYDSSVINDVINLKQIGGKKK